MDITQYFINSESGKRTFIKERFLDSLSDQTMENKTLQAISELPVPTFWTTNYGHLLEKYLGSSGKRINVKNNFLKYVLSIL